MSLTSLDILLGKSEVRKGGACVVCARPYMLLDMLLPPNVGVVLPIVFYLLLDFLFVLRHMAIGHIVSRFDHFVEFVWCNLL